MSEDEDTPKDEDDGALRNEDQEALVEEIEEHKEMVSFPYPHVTISYDVLARLEENNKILEDDDYWKFMGPPMYVRFFKT